MAVTMFVILSAIWLTGLSYLKMRCVEIEGDFDAHGGIGAFIGTGWLRGSTEASRRWRTLALHWTVVGLMALVFVTALLVRFERP